MKRPPAFYRPPCRLPTEFEAWLVETCFISDGSARVIASNGRALLGVPSLEPVFAGEVVPASLAAVRASDDGLWEVVDGHPRVLRLRAEKKSTKGAKAKMIRAGREIRRYMARPPAAVPAGGALA